MKPHQMPKPQQTKPSQTVTMFDDDDDDDDNNNDEDTSASGRVRVAPK